MPHNNASQKRSCPTDADSNDYPSKRSRGSDPLPPTGAVLRPAMPYTGYRSELPQLLQLNCLMGGDNIQCTFSVQIRASQTVAALRKVIKEKKKPLLDHLPSDGLDLWKVCLPIGNHFQEHIGVPDEKPLLPVHQLSTVFIDAPVMEHLHIIVKEETTATMLPNSYSLPWLFEIHRKLWRKRCLLHQIFRTATLTKADFIQLQDQLQKRNPNRNSKSYVAKNVLAVKSAFLRSRSVPSVTSDAPGLVPRLVFDASDVVDDDDTDDTAIFPCTFHLTVLELKSGIRVPQLMLLRKEWGDMFNERKKGARGSAVFTGQPGIGKTCLLYFILIRCIIHAQPIVFQDMKGNVFIIDNTVRRQEGMPIMPADDVLTLVDADGEYCQPDPYLFYPSNLRILLISSPRERKDRKWLTQYVGEMGSSFLMEPWSRKELLVASLFLASIDITLKRFQKTSYICGLIPRSCFQAAKSSKTLDDAKKAITTAIDKTQELSRAIVDVHSGTTIHRAFQIRPLSSTRRSCDSCLTEPVSDWAFEQMMDSLDRRSADAAYDFYRAIQGSSYSSDLRRKMFETKVHLFFRNISKSRTFTIHSLDDPSTTFNITFSFDTKHLTFGVIQEFSGQLVLSVERNKSCYFKPLSPVFPTFDSFLYQHGIPQSGCLPLISLQVTTAAKHPISITGLEKLQISLKKNIAHLKASKDKKLIILFVVPTTIAASFGKQKIKGAEKVGHWNKKTSQYVLALPEKEVFRSK